MSDKNCRRFGPSFRGTFKAFRLKIGNVSGGPCPCISIQDSKFQIPHFTVQVDCGRLNIAQFPVNSRLGISFLENTERTIRILQATVLRQP